MCYVVVCNLEILIPRVIAIFVRICYPWARYWVVVAEQFSSAIAAMFTRMDSVIYASYCEFAAKYCRSRRLMCDVTCSFVDHVLSQSRPVLPPVSQN
uniref:Secreted protein n=1 Tax=Caenorhabditis tropicalis TaxID=1561998 RepID=A0A1I7TYX7_9PELO